MPASPGRRAFRYRIFRPTRTTFWAPAPVEHVSGIRSRAASENTHGAWAYPEKQHERSIWSGRLVAARSAPPITQWQRGLSTLRRRAPRYARAPASLSRGQSGSSRVCRRSRRIRLDGNSRRGRIQTRPQIEPRAARPAEAVPLVCLSSVLSAIRAERTAVSFTPGHAAPAVEWDPPKASKMRIIGRV
jgi:hypothetical protein